MSANNDFDFGFTAMTEDELKSAEKELQQRVEASSKVITKTMKDKNDAIRKLRSMILPLLDRLSKDADKPFIHWPDRASIIKDFKTRLDDFVDVNTQE
jgi:hypothetical protein